MKKVLTAAMAALVLGGTLMASMGSAEAYWRHRHYGWGGGAVAAGVVGALALGAIAASAASGPYYACHIERRPVYNAWGDMIGWRRIRVC